MGRGLTPEGDDLPLAPMCRSFLGDRLCTDADEAGEEDGGGKYGNKQNIVHITTFL